MDPLDQPFTPIMPPLRRGNVPIQLFELVDEVFELDSTHVAIANESLVNPTPLGVLSPDLKRIRLTHHRLAQFLASGTPNVVAARLCNMDPGRVNRLMADPAFAELLAYYKDAVEEEWRGFVEIAADLSIDLLSELQYKLDTNPDQFSPAQLLDAIRTVADRSGNAPVQRTQNTNINVNLGDRMKAARERANQQLIEGSARLVGSDE